MSDLVRNLDTIEALRLALATWQAPGERVELHAAAKIRLRITWPELAAALDRAAGDDATALRADAMRAAAGQVPARAPVGPWATAPAINRPVRKES